MLFRSIALGSGAQADEAGLLSLLTRPGFSLSSKVTKWSGRGVGLDAVERSIRQARGTLRLENERGRGFAAEIRLPLALSLVEGFTAKAGETALLVPFDAVSSCEAIEDVEERRLYRAVRVRGELLPAIDLSLPDDLFLRYRGVGAELAPTRPYLVVLQHPVTTEYDESRHQVDETLYAVKDAGLPVLWFWPNVDAGSDGTSMNSSAVTTAEPRLLRVTTASGQCSRSLPMATEKSSVP